MKLNKKRSIKELNICFIAGTLGAGGAERQLFLMLSALQSIGCKVSLINLETGGYWEERIKMTGIQYFHLDNTKGKLARFRKIIKIIKIINPDIIQSQHFYTNLYAALAGFFVGAKSIGGSRSELMNEIKETGRLGYLCFKLPEFMIANSQQSVEQCLSLGKSKNKVFYLPNAIDTIKFKPNPTGHETFTILTIGRMTPVKRFDKFLDLLFNLKQKFGSQIRGILIGDGPLASNIAEKAKELGLDSENLLIVQHTTSPEIYMNQADLFVLTSDYEGTPNVVLEAMSVGLPVLVPRIGNLNYFIDDQINGLFFDGSTSQLTEKVMAVYENKFELSILGRNAENTIKKSFSLDLLEENLIYIYKRIFEI